MPCGCPYPIAPGMAGMVFREEFINIPLLTDNGGVLINSPAVDRGVTLNGTTQYVSYPNRSLGYFPGTGFIVVRFVPQFSTNNNATRALVASGTYGVVPSIYLRKQDNANLNRLIATLGAGVVYCEEVNYTALWNVGQENVVAVSLEGSSSAMWLNGTLLTTTKTAMVGNNMGSFGLGGLGGVVLFSGSIKSVRIGTKPITALDVPVLSVAS